MGGGRGTGAGLREDALVQGVIGERVCQAAAVEVKSCPLNYRVESNPSLASSRLPR